MSTRWQTEAFVQCNAAPARWAALHWLHLCFVWPDTTSCWKGTRSQSSQFDAETHALKCSAIAPNRARVPQWNGFARGVCGCSICLSEDCTISGSTAEANVALSKGVARHWMTSAPAVWALHPKEAKVLTSTIGRPYGKIPLHCSTSTSSCTTQHHRTANCSNKALCGDRYVDDVYRSPA